MISKKTFKRAEKIIEKYNLQQVIINKKKQKGKFEFLWFDLTGKDHVRFIKAKSIESACKKFLALKLQTLDYVDYEARLNGVEIEIQNIPCMKGWTN